MNSRPLVSVCIPLYNGAASLTETLDSILCQTYDNIEIIICDDNSSDDPCSVIDKKNDPRIHYYKNPQNLGQCNNYNRCIELSKGKYIKLMGQDDIIAPTMIEEYVNILENDISVSLITCQSGIIDENGNIISERKYFSEDTIFDGNKFARKTFKNARNLFGEPALMIFRSELYPKVKMDPKFPTNLDWDFCVQLCQYGKVYYRAAKLAEFRITTSSQSGNSYKTKHKYLKQQSIDLFDKHKENLKLTNSDRVWFGMLTEMLLYAKQIYVSLITKRKGN